MATRALRVPLMHQQRHKPYCGAASAKMVLAYHGVRMSQKRIVREMGVREASGVDMIKMATFFLRQGFDVTLVCWLRRWPTTFADMDGDDLRRALLRWGRRDVVHGTRYRSSCRKHLDELYALGGRIEARPVTVADIAAALVRKEPPILNLDVSRLWRLGKLRAGHYVVPVAVSDDAMTMRDPNRRHGGTRTYPLADVLHACYRWNAGAVFVGPKR